jgi:hypothetical protein
MHFKGFPGSGIDANFSQNKASSMAVQTTAIDPGSQP